MEHSNFIKGRRLRIFAGPNGSGKSTIFDEISNRFDVGYYINPDLIEKEIKNKFSLDISHFGLSSISAETFLNFIENHSLKTKAETKGHRINMLLDGDKIKLNSDFKPSYEAALIADFLRHFLILKGSKLAFETVMSHKSKLEILDLASQNGYKNYLYFICTASPKINIDRVKSRVKKGGHFVDPEDIESRYYKTLSQLKAAVQRTYRTFVYDNSEKSSTLILEVFQGKEVTFHSEKIPAWVNEYLLKM